MPNLSMPPTPRRSKSPREQMSKNLSCPPPLFPYRDSTSYTDGELEPLAPSDPTDPSKPAAFGYITENIYISPSLVKSCLSILIQPIFVS